MSLSVFVALYFLEAGLFFLIVPWTMVWSLNPLLHSPPTIGMWADKPFVRGFVSGLGMLHLIIGIRDLVLSSRQRRSRVQ